MQSKKPASKKPAKAKELSSTSRLSRGMLLGFALIFAVAGGYVLLRSFAAPAAPNVYLTPTTNVFGASTSFSVQLRETSGSTNVNAIQANISYPTNLLTFVSLDYTGSAFTTQAQSTGGSGTINLARAVVGGVTGDQLVATINFKTTTTGGAASVAFTSGTALVNSSTNQDILGSLANTTGGTYTTDTVPPTVSITAPSNNSTQSVGNVVNVTASASDASSAVSKVEFYVDGSLSGTVTSSPYTYAWNTTGVTLGAHTLVAKAYDTFNNVASSSTVNVTVADQTPPTTPGSFHASTTTLNSVSLAWTASTDNVGVTSYTLKRGSTVLSSTITPTTLTYNDTGLTPNTAYSYTLQAVDGAGNVSTAATLNVTTPAVTPGDLNQDGHVDSSDLSIMVANYGTTNAVADINKDGTDNIFDLSILISHYGS